MESQQAQAAGGRWGVLRGGWGDLAYAVLIVVFAALPIFFHSWWATHDGLAYPPRLAEFAYLVASGEWYPRWAPSFYWGFGYPVFNFFPPLWTYLGTAVHLAGLPIVASVATVEVMTFAVAFLSCYRLGRVYGDRRTAMAVATAGILLPYRFVDVYVRGDVAEALATAIMPLVLAEAVSLPRGGGRAAGLRLAGATALVFYSHTIAAVATAILLSAFGLYFLLAGSWRVFVATAGWSGAGLLVSAASWLPAFVERELVNVEIATTARSYYTFRWQDHFLEWWQRLDPHFGFGLSLSGPGDQMSFSASFLVIAALVWALLQCRHSEGRARYGAPLAGFFAVQLMMLPASTPIWRAVPLLPYFQFPWRFLMLDSIAGLVLLALAIEDYRSRPRPREGVVPAAVLVAGTALVWLFADPSSVRVVAERAPLAIGALGAALVLLAHRCDSGITRWVRVAAIALAVPVLDATANHAARTPLSEWVSTQNREMLDPNARERAFTRWRDGSIQPLQTTDSSELLPLTAAKDPPSASLSARVQFEAAPGQFRLDEKRGTRRRWTVSSPVEQVVLLPLFQFPGWDVTLDGEEVYTEAGKSGLIRLELPAGAHVITARYRGTPLQRASEWISVAAAAALALLAFRELGARSERRRAGSPS